MTKNALSNTSRMSGYPQYTSWDWHSSFPGSLRSLHALRHALCVLRRGHHRSRVVPRGHRRCRALRRDRRRRRALQRCLRLRSCRRWVAVYRPVVCCRRPAKIRNMKNLVQGELYVRKGGDEEKNQAASAKAQQCRVTMALARTRFAPCSGLGGFESC